MWPKFQIEIQFFHNCVARGKKFNKMTITREGYCMDTNPSKILLVSLVPTDDQNLSSIGESHLGTFPRKFSVL
jgi:hypothetical protein